ncbi:AzlD domain-containing protein [Pseudogracilibacillus sp. SO30301A]|uniref:AzlD domain-containing protein n=1 Tax=Pseudogracilibacillus sp. SO30301A TaxID=3098291 RepID=UPI00300E45CF
MLVSLTIVGMAIVTYIFRLIPVFIIGRFTIPNWLENWLKYVPYAALAALIYPGILTVNEQDPLVGLIGGIFAVVLAYFRLHILFVIIGSIMTAYLLS